MTGLALAALAGCWCLASSADDTDAKRGNLLPVEYAGDNVGGFLGWETGGANVRLLSERGPDGGKVLRFTDSGGTFSFTHAKRRLAPGGRYRLTANVRARNLNGPKRFELMLHNWPWGQEMKANIPRETDGRWEPASREGVLPPSENDAYDCTVYCSGPLAEDAFFDLADLKLEAVDEKAESGASPIPASAPYRARICPVDPPLAEIDPRQAKMRFYYGGPVADANGRACRLRARLGASVREVPLGASHQASVDFGPVAPGRHPLVAEILEPTGDGVTASNDYVAIVRPVIGNPTPLRRLNNLAWEICAKPLADGETAFTLAKAGWVYVGTDRPYETVVCDVDESFRGVVRYRPHEPNGSTRFLEAGEHVVRTRGVPEDAKGTLYVRLVKPITVGGFANALAGKYMTCVRDEAYFERCGLLGTINFTNTRIGMSDSVRAKFADRGVEILGDVSCAAWLPMRDDLPALVRHFTDHEYFRKGIPFTIDENGVNVAARKKYNAAEAMWEVYRSGLRMDVFLEDGYRGRFNRPGLDYPDLSAYVNVGEGRSFMCSECYWRSPVDEEEMAATVDFMRRQIREMRALVPSAPSHFIYYLNGFMQIGSWTSWIYPHVDMKAFDAKILHLLATDPEFADIGGVGCAGMYCAEDYLRSMYAAFRHYVLEGRTDDFCALHGYSVFPGHLRNGDFDEGWDGWTVRPAEEGSLRLGHKKGLGGPACQQRRCWWFRNGTYAVGENYALFTANGRKPNALLQRITGLRPGELYQVTYVTMNPTNAARPVLWAKVRGAEDIPELRHVCTCTGGKTKAPVTSTRLVFRATDTTATLAFSDWLAKDYVPAEGAQCMLNYIGCHRYFVRDEEELEFLRSEAGALSRKAVCGL